MHTKKLAITETKRAIPYYHMSPPNISLTFQILNQYPFFMLDARYFSKSIQHNNGNCIN